MNSYQIIDNTPLNPIVSVSMLTYNHQDYIAEAIESVLMQETTFNVQLVIAEDFSTDTTRDIIIDYQKRYPNKIKLLLQNYNVGASKNAVAILENLNGKYIALCEGDDYWTDSLKLQKQVDFLENNPDFVMSFHAIESINELSIPDYKYKVPPKDVLSFNDLILKHYIPTASLVFFKSSLPTPLPEWFSKCPMGDVPMELLIADKGKTRYFPEVMGCYRQHSGGITQTSEQKKKGRRSYLIMYISLLKHFGFRHILGTSVMIVKHSLGFILDKFK